MSACGSWCGHCGACSLPFDAAVVTYQCFWCNELIVSPPEENDNDDHYPYCSMRCADLAQTDGQAVRRTA